MEGHQVQAPLIVALFGVISGFSFGYNTGIISLARDFVIKEFDVPAKSFLDGFIVSSVLLGGMIGSLSGGLLMNRYGRRVANSIGSALCIFGLCSAFSPDVIVFYIFRVFLGAGIGLTAVVCPAYVNDMAEHHLKATLGVVFQIAITVGIFVSFLVGWAMTTKSIDLDDFYRWRIMIGIGELFPIILLIFTFFFMKPERDDVPLKEEANLIDAHNSDALPVSIINLFRHHPTQILTATILSATLQLTGINAVMFFGPEIIKASGFKDGNLLNLAIGGWNSITTLVAVLLVRRMGRRFLMLVGTGLLTIALVGIALTFNLTHDCNATQTTFYEAAPATNTCPRVYGVIVGLALFLLGFEMGPGCLFWVLANEIFPRSFSELGASYTNIAQWGFNLLVSSTFISIPPLYSFWIFAGIGVVCTVYLFLALPRAEPKGDRESSIN